jgi:DNA-binding NtrC family response regulator
MDRYSSKPLVYIVDDVMVIAESLAAILRRSGLRSLSFRNPTLALFQARLSPPHLFLINEVMSAMPGADLAVSMIQAAPNCRVLYYSPRLNPSKLDRVDPKIRRFEAVTKPIETELRREKGIGLTIQGTIQGMDRFLSSVLPGIPFS